MANANSPFGFQVLKTEGKENRVTVYGKTAAAIYQNDVVKMTSTGQVAVAAAGDVILGVAAETKAAAAADIAIYDDPNQCFMAQADADFALTDVGNNANITATAADTSLNRSKHDIDTASFATTNTLQFKLLGLVSRGTNAYGSYAIVKCKPNHHFFSSGVTGV